MLKVELPPTKTKPMNPGTLADLIYLAMVAINAYIGTRKFPSESVAVFAPVEHGWSTQELVRPRLKSALLDTVRDKLALPEVRDVIDYLWEHGRTITLAGKDEVPTKRSWEEYACHFVIAIPLMELWDKSSVHAFCRHQHWHAWKIPAKAMRQRAELVARAECGLGRLIRIVTPLPQVVLADFQKADIASGIVLKIWSHEERSWYARQSESAERFDQMLLPHQSGTIIEMTLSEQDLIGPKPQPDDLAEAVGAILAKVKWAVSQICPGQPIIELPTTIESFSFGRSYPTLRRQGTLRYPPTGITLRQGDCRVIRRLLKDYDRAATDFKDLDDIVWMFDRAMLASTPRDTLLEATIGLERLLVNGAGENARRFRVYGAALLPQLDPVVVESDLKKIYNERSGVAHGTKGKASPAKAFYGHGRNAMVYFSGILYSAVALVNAGRLEVAGDKGLSGGLETYLNALLYAAAQQNLSTLRR